MLSPIILAVALLAIVLAVVWWYNRRSGPPLGSYKSGDFCYPCASPIDAQFGSRLYIAGKANIDGAQRRFFLHNNSGQPMTVKSFTFGGYHRKWGGQVTEMILPNLMDQYGYSDSVAPGGVFSLDVDNDSHVMYKGWYNSPLFIAYCLGPETPDTQYTILGWAPMRLQDEVNTYKFFYDESLKRELLRKVPDDEREAYKSMLGQTAEYKLARNAAVHWETGSGPGKARALPTISTDKNSQCKYVTTVNTFDSVNVHVPLCHLSVKITGQPTRGNSIADCLRQIATVGSAAIMDKSADLDNFMKEPAEWMPILVTSIATALWFYVEFGGIAVNIIADIVNVIAPGAGTALSVLYDLMDEATKVLVSSGVLALVPGIGDQLNEIGMQFANGNTITDIAEPFIKVLDAGTAAAAGNFAKGGKVAAQKGFIAAFKKGIKLAAKTGLKIGAQMLAKKFPSWGSKAKPILMAVFTTAINLAVNKGVGFAKGQFTAENVEEIMEVAVKGTEIEGDIKQVFSDILNGEYKGAAAEIALVLNDKKQDLLEKGLKASKKEVMNYISEQINVGTSQIAPPSGPGVGKEKWEPGTPGKDGYALNRKLWVNRELQKDKFAKDAACSGNWVITYHDS